MPAGGLVVGGIAALGAGAIGGVTANNAQNDAKSATYNAVQQYLALHVPDPAEQQIILQRYRQTGQMDPRLATAFQQAKSGMSNIQTDPGLRAAQANALASLENEANNGGHTLAQDAYLNHNRNLVNAQNAGRQGAIEQMYAQRGMGGQGGLMLSALEQNNQNMTQNENEASMQAAAQAQQNALAALQGAGTMAGQQQQQQFNQAASIAQAQDSINQFNTQMNQGVENANVAAQNQAQAYNVQEQQQLANQNTGLSNYEQQYNKQLQQQQYQNQLAKSGGAAAAYQNQAGQFNQQAATNANMWGNIGQGALKAGAGFGQVYGSKPAPTGTESGSAAGSNAGSSIGADATDDEGVANNYASI